MPGKLHFDVTARDSASQEFSRIASQLEQLERELDQLDGKRVQADVRVDTPSTAPLTALRAHLDQLDGRVARARVEVDVDRSVGERIAGVASGLSTFGSVASAAASGAVRFRSAAQMLVDPSQIPLIASISDAIASKFHSAVETARGGVDRLSTANKALGVSLLALGSAGNAAAGIGALATSLVELSGAAVLVPAAAAGAAVAIGTLKIALASFGDAVMADTPKKFRKATEDMAAGALQTVLAVREVKASLSGLGPVGKAVQNNFFDGLAQQVKTLGSVYLPIMKTGLGGVATQFNGMAKSAGTALLSMESVGQVRTIIQNTDFAIGAMRGTLANAATGFLKLGAAGSEWLPRFGGAIDAAASKFTAWSTRITSDGTFDRWVGQSVTAFGQLGTILGNTGSIIGSVFSALNGNGAGLLATLASLTTQMRGFLQSAEGASALRALGQTMSVVGNAVSQVLMAALRQLGPIMTALAPAAQALAVALGANLVTIINVAGPALQRFAAALSANPELLVALARAAAAVVIGFAPMVAIIGVAATVLKGILLANLAAAALGALGLSGTIAGRILTALVSPMALIREAMPLIARGVGLLAAQLGFMAGPIGVLIVAFATLYASSSQFRDAVNGVAQVVGGLFMRALSDAGEIINSTVLLIGRIGSALGDATAGIRSFGSSVASAFGPIGAAVEGALGDLFDILGKLPGAALAAFAAFRVFGLIAPLFVTASTAVAAFSARMLALQASSALGAAAAGAAGRAAAGLATALSRAGAALPVLGVALIAVGAIYDQIRSRADDFAESVVAGSMSMSQAFQQQAAIYGEGFSGFVNAVSGGVAGMARWQDANLNAALSQAEVRAKVEETISALPALEEAQARVQVSQRNLNDAILEFGPNSREASTAAQVLARDKADLAGKEKTLESATRGTTEAMQAQADQMAGQINTALGYAQAVRATAEAQKAAEAAIKQYGATSEQAQIAVEDLASKMNRQAESARAQAEALGGPRAGLEAYNTELLRSADLSSSAGKAAFALLVSGLDSAGLAALSASAKMSGLRTEVLTLPDGRTVTVVVNADRAKLDSVRQAVDEISRAPFIGTVQILATADGARNSIIQTIQFADGSKGTIKIEGDGSPALLTVGNAKYTIDQTTGTIQILGNPAPGEANLSGLKVKVDATTGVMTIDGNPGPADAKTNLAKSRMDTSIGVMTLDGNPAPANGKITGAITLANGSKGTITIDGNQAPANGKVTAAITYADGSRGTIQVDANAAAATAAINAAARDRTATIYVREVMLAGYAAAGSSRVGGLAGGGVIGYSGGGVVPLRAAGGMVLPGYGPGRDTVPALLSRGESVLVPELTRTLGARRIMAANSEASGGRPGTAVGDLAGLMDGTLRGGSSGIASVTDIRRGSGGSAAASSAAWAGIAAVATSVTQLRGDVQQLAGAIRSARPITVEDRSGNPVETARATQLALRIA